MSERNDKIYKDYYGGWPKPTCPYVKDCLWAAQVAVEHLRKIKSRPSRKKKCVVFDIDDTIVMGDPKSIVGIHEMELGTHDGQDIFILPKNEPIVKVVEFAKSLDYVIIILTARPKASQAASVANMNMFKIPYDAIIMNDRDDDPCFKVNVRRKIANNYDIVMTIGDQITDVLCPGGTTSFIKLPDPESLASYAWLV